LIFPEDDVELPPFSRAEEMGAEYSVLGLSTSDHVMALYRPWLARHSILSSKELASCPDGQPVRVAGLVVVHQAPPTAKGHHFVTLEDEEGMVNVIVRPAIYQQYQRVLRTVPLLTVEGTLQRKNGIVNVLAARAGPVPIGHQP
jgi:error-prone DNA polymerase